LRTLAFTSGLWWDPVSLDSTLLIAPSVFSKAYLSKSKQRKATTYADGNLGTGLGHDYKCDQLKSFLLV